MASPSDKEAAQGERPTASSPPQARPTPQELVLLVASGLDRGKTLRLERGTYQVGKASDCDLLLTDDEVSRRHLQISVLDNGILVKDLGSKNGSHFQSARFSEVLVGAGAVVTVGKSELKFTLPAQATTILPSSLDHFGGLVGRSLAMREVFAVLERLATSDAPVLIEGETGTGKEVCAEAIHSESARAGGPFVICDLAGLSRSLIESELFGHVRGAFTGADSDREGAFMLARGGTIFIDEVGELEIDLQPRLLRVLEQRKIKPVGATRYIEVDVRVIAATNRALGEERKAGRFRSDLYHRLTVLRTTLPPLRQRKEDIALLLKHLFSDREVNPTDETMALLAEYDWPGNVRELKNVIERGLSLVAAGAPLTADLLGLERTADPEAAHDFYQAKQQLIASWEQTYLTDLLRRAGGNVAKAARACGVNRPYLYRLLKKHGLHADAE